ncbi:MAG: cation:proton antiporter [Candidatus Berkelbacteria bacterium]
MDLFVGISLTLVVAAVLAGILQKLKQPVIIGHILTGLIVGPYLFHNAQFQDIFDSLSQIGIALLLFIIGLNLSPRVIKEVGKASFITGFGQIILTSLAGFGVSRWLGFSTVSSIYLGLALTFSSTIIIMKLLSDKKDLSKFYSKFSIGILLFQDILVAILLIAVSALSGGATDWGHLIVTLLKGIVVFDLIILAVMYVIPRLSAFFAQSQEFLFLFAIGWGLGLATLFHVLGFPMEIGALVAGVALSTTPFHFEMSSRLRPIRDFFVILFFILLGSRITPAAIVDLWRPALLLSLFIIIVKPLLVSVMVSLFGYRKKVSFMTAINFTQVSEFSIIFLILGEKVGHIPSSFISLITLVSLITIMISSYLVIYSNRIFPFFQKFMFERTATKSGQVRGGNFEVILFGFNRVGHDLVNDFKDLGDKFLVVDFDPEAIKKLTELGINCRYGDADDNEFLEELNLSKVKMIISTIPDFDTNELLVGKIRLVNEKAVIIVLSQEAEEAIDLYEIGATYVITPHFLGGKFASMLISKYGFDIEKFVTEKQKHLRDLEKQTEFMQTAITPEVYK